MPHLTDRKQFALACVLLMVVSACGGGGGSGSPATPTPVTTTPPQQEPEPAFGLVMRASLQAPQFAINPVGTAEIELFDAFPSLNFNNAVYLTAIPGSSDLAIVEQGGRIVRFNPSNASSVTVMLDISARQPMQANEEGLLGLAFDPDYENNGRAYVHYTEHGPRRSVLSRLLRSTVNPLQLDSATEQVLLEQDQPFSNHNGGMLAYGPDNMLYMALGDGGSANDPQNNSQRLSNLLGKLLRLDVSGAGLAIPADNPFVGQAGARGEIWAYGLRNPWRFSFDRLTGTLWLGDVGQNSREEIDIITRGGNYGWRVFEAEERFDDSQNSLPDSAFTAPVFSYGRDSGFSITGGYVYRGSTAPSIQGQYVYADFGGEVWALEYDGASVGENRSLGILNSVSSFGEDATGELFAVSLGGSVFGFRESSSGNAAAPGLLSETGLFADLVSLTPANGMIEYAVNAEFWSDGARKQRWIGIPDGQQIEFSNTGNWVFPLGTVVVKHFELELQEGVPESARRMETRVLVNTDNGFQGYVYRWNDDQTDARLLSGSEQQSLQIETANGNRTQVWHYPSRAECLACHTVAAGEVLGVNTRQMNRTFAYPAASDNQLRSWNNIGLFSEEIGAAEQWQQMVDATDTAQSLENRARAYLDANCANCHRPGGASGSSLDLRYSTETNDLNAINIEPQVPSASTADRLIVPGNRESSVVLQRMRSLDESRMPPISSNTIDREGVDLIGEWIDAL